MGDRYFLEVKCHGCHFVDAGVYYAPTCGLTDWKCPQCQRVVDLNAYLIKAMIDELKPKRK